MKKFKLTKKIKYNQVEKRHMKTMLHEAGDKFVKFSHSVLPKNIHSSMSYMKNVRLKKSSQAVKDLAADSNGKHVHRVKEICSDIDCDKKKCPTLCTSIQETQTVGHFTRDPITGKFSTHLGEYDTNGNPNNQYYTRNTNKNLKTSGQKTQQYQQNKEIKDDHKTNTYTSKPEISSKLDE